MTLETLLQRFSLALILMAPIVPRSAAAASPWPPVPSPTETVSLDVEEGGIYPFPFIFPKSCGSATAPGCFKVESVHLEGVTIRYSRIDVEGEKLIPARFTYRTPVSREGTEYELYVVKLGDIREEWIYAVLEAVDDTRARLRFLKYPAFVTKKARITVTVGSDLTTGRLRETYRVEAQEPITLIGLKRFAAAIGASTRIDSVSVNGEHVSFPFRNILNLNLPSGTHVVTADLSLGGERQNLSLQGTLFEPRKMALIEKLDFRAIVATKPQRRVAVSVEALGLPERAWQNFRSAIRIEPTPLDSVAVGLSATYLLPPTKDVRVRTRPRIVYEKRSYPVMIHLSAE